MFTPRSQVLQHLFFLFFSPRKRVLNTLQCKNMNYGKWLVQWQQLTLSSKRGISQGNFYFLRSLPQDSIHDNNVQLKRKKKPQKSCLGVVCFLQVWVSKQAALNHWEKTNHPSRGCPGMFLKRSKDSWLCFSRTAKIHQEAAATTNSLLSSVTTYTTSRTKVLEKHCSTEKQSQAASNEISKLSSTPAVAQKWGQRLQKGTRIYWQ